MQGFKADGNNVLLHHWTTRALYPPRAHRCLYASIFNYQIINKIEYLDTCNTYINISIPSAEEMQKCVKHDGIHRTQAFKLYYWYAVLGKQHVCSYSYWSVVVSLLNEDVPGTVTDVFEAVRAQQDPAVPPRDHHQHVTHVQDLHRSQRKHISEANSDCSHSPSNTAWRFSPLARTPVACKQIHNMH